MFRRVADDHERIRAAWQSFETDVGLKGRKFFGVFDASTRRVLGVREAEAL